MAWGAKAAEAAQTEPSTKRYLTQQVHAVTTGGLMRAIEPLVADGWEVVAQGMNGGSTFDMLLRLPNPDYVPGD